MRTGLTEKDYKRNFWAFVWHATFLALSKSFIDTDIDTDTVLPALILKAGGSVFLIGLMTAIMTGSAKFMQLFFAPYISSRRHKNTQLLIAINIRIVAVLALALLILYFNSLPNYLFFVLLFVLITVFSWSGAYGGVAYTDILGKSILPAQRMRLFSLKQTFQAVGFVASAMAVKIILNRYPFPNNYAYSFIIAGIILAIGSLGFWMLREKIIEPKERKSIWTFFKLIPAEIKKNQNLKYFLITVNLLGIFVAFTPFLVSYAKEKAELTNRIVGNILIIKMSGVVLGSLLVYMLKKKVRYKHLLIAAAVISVIVPISALFLVNNMQLYQMLFFVSGLGFSLIRIANEGIVIEISDDHNRAEYAGIVGAGNISGIIFPFAIGSLLSFVSYTAVFIVVALIALSSLFSIRKLDCR